jgi:hypothetical protein
MPIDDFELLAKDLVASGLIVDLPEKIKKWRALGVKTGYFEGYRRL